jgi:hypothetical protein
LRSSCSGRKSRYLLKDSGSLWERGEFSVWRKEKVTHEPSSNCFRNFKTLEKFLLHKANSSVACDILGVISTIEENCKTKNIDYPDAFTLEHLKTNEKILERKVE